MHGSSTCSGSIRLLATRRLQPAKGKMFQIRSSETYVQTDLPARRRCPYTSAGSPGLFTKIQASESVGRGLHKLFAVAFLAYIAGNECTFRHISDPAFGLAGVVLLFRKRAQGQIGSLACKLATARPIPLSVPVMIATLSRSRSFPALALFAVIRLRGNLPFVGCGLFALGERRFWSGLFWSQIRQSSRHKFPRFFSAVGCQSRSFQFVHNRHPSPIAA